MEIDNIKMYRYKTTTWQRLKIWLFGTKVLEECEKEEVEMILDDEWYIERR